MSRRNGKKFVYIIYNYLFYNVGQTGLYTKFKIIKKSKYIIVILSSVCRSIYGKLHTKLQYISKSITKFLADDFIKTEPRNPHAHTHLCYDNGQCQPLQIVALSSFCRFALSIWRPWYAMECSNQHFNWWRTSAAYENTSKNPAQQHNAKPIVGTCSYAVMSVWHALRHPLWPRAFFCSSHVCVSVCRCVCVSLLLYCSRSTLAAAWVILARARFCARVSRLVKTTWVGWIQDQRNTHNNAKYIVFILKAALYFYRDGVYGRKAPLNHATTCKQRSNSRFACQCASPCVAWLSDLEACGPYPPSQSLEYRCEYKRTVYRGLLCFQHIKYPLEIVESMNCM